MMIVVLENKHTDDIVIRRLTSEESEACTKFVDTMNLSMVDALQNMANKDEYVSHWEYLADIKHLNEAAPLDLV